MQIDTQTKYYFPLKTWLLDRELFSQIIFESMDIMRSVCRLVKASNLDCLLNGAF